MVLEEATRSSPETSFSETPPSSDADPYYGDSNPTYIEPRDSSFIAVNKAPHTVYVNTQNLPKPISIFGYGSIPAPLAKAVQEACHQSSVVLARPLKQEEADAMAYHYARAMRTASWGNPLGLIVGALWAFRGQSTYKFPGWTPGENFNPGKLGPFTGRRARLGWHFLRYQVYTFLGAMGGSIFMSSYALTQGIAGRAMDPRLKEIIEAMSHQAKGGIRTGIDDAPGRRATETYEMARQRRQAQDAWKERRQPQQQQQQQQSSQTDDMSPSGGAFGAEYIDLGSANVSDTSMMSDDQAKRQLERLETQQRADYDRSNAPERSVAASRQQNNDNASSISRQASGGSGGSAWERLRQQAASGNQGQSSGRNGDQARSRDNASSGDSFSFSSKDEDRQLARAEAQKDFDSRVDRERTGRDFEDRKRW